MLSKMKRENKLTLIFTTIIFLILAGTTSFLGVASSSLITGNVVLNTASDGQATIQQILRNSEFDLIGSGAKFCVQIKNQDDEIFAYKVRKNGNMFRVTESEKFCDGSTNEDFVITFENYRDLINAKELPNLRYFRLSSVEKSVTFWQSRFIRVGGLVVQNDEFNEKYCSFLSKHFSNNLRNWGIECESDESQSFLVFLFKKFWWVFLIVLFIGFISFVGFNLFKDDDETVEENTLDQLHSYIEQSRNLGFGDYQIKETLLSSGWDEKTIKLAFEKIRKHHLSSVFNKFEKITELPFITKSYDEDEEFEY